MFAHACKRALEGVVSKVRDSVYPLGRNNTWVKKTCAQREMLTVAGFALGGKKWDAWAPTWSTPAAASMG
jgi:bifunctional non-homologous end joining protein LigD